MKTKAILMPDGWWETIPIEIETPETSNVCFITKVDNLLDILDWFKREEQ